MEFGILGPSGSHAAERLIVCGGGTPAGRWAGVELEPRSRLSDPPPGRCALCSLTVSLL
jgi:hypothetical protein